ncbi:MAG: hypothetical protein KDB16_05215 [Acidimicrobiales bacterium]|nr:hypothetical protein [Acidimicrobiales bacterium]
MTPQPDVVGLSVPDGYTRWTAQAKLSWLLDDLIGPSVYSPINRPENTFPKPSQLPSVVRVVASRRQLVDTLDRADDLMLSTRPKVIHTVGAVAPIELVTTTDSQFSGMLAAPPNGGAIGLIRMSYAAPTTRKKAYVPGFGLKLLVDGMSSQDTLAINHSNGQGRDFNMFSNSMSHDLTDQHSELRPTQKLMSRLFERVSCEPRRLSIAGFCSVDRHGRLVDDPVVPTKLVFQPTAAARSSFRNRAGHDFRDVLAEIEPGTTLYDVYAQGHDRPVAHLATTGRFTASLGGDRLFFRHVQVAEDRVQDLRS